MNNNDLANYLALMESTGGLARRWIEVQQGKDIQFIHATTKEVYHLTNLLILPRDPELKYDDTPESKGTLFLDKAIQGVVEGLKPAPVSIETFGLKNGKAAIIILMQNSAGETCVYVKKTLYKRSLGSNAIFWQTTDFAKDTGLWAQTPQMKKAGIPIEPTDFVTAGKKYNINQLITAVTTGIQKTTVPPELKEGLPVLLQNILSNSTTPVPNIAEFQSAIEIKLSELAAPIALKTGNFIKGDYDAVSKGLLQPMGTDWSFATAVGFPAKAERLIDAVMYFGDDKLDISVKDSSGGGSPSTATIAETLTTAEFNTSFKRKYLPEINAIKTLDGESAIAGPLTLAKQFGVLADSDIAYLMSIYSKGVKAAPRLSKNWNNLLKQVPYQTDTNHPEYQLGYHLLALVAKYVALKLNEDEKKITGFFREVLNKSSLVQVYAKTKVDKATNGLHFNQFSVVWPPVFDGSIKVDADSYTARTRPSRKISFRFSGGKKPTAPVDIDTKPKKVVKKKPLRNPVATTARQKRGIEKPKAGVGREKR